MLFIAAYLSGLYTKNRSTTVRVNRTHVVLQSESGRPTKCRLLSSKHLRLFPFSHFIPSLALPVVKLFIVWRGMSFKMIASLTNEISEINATTTNRRRRSLIKSTLFVLTLLVLMNLCWIPFHCGRRTGVWFTIQGEGNCR